MGSSTGKLLVGDDAGLARDFEGHQAARLVSPRRTSRA